MSKDIIHEQIPQYVSRIKSLESALSTIKKETGEKTIYDIAESALKGDS